MLSNFNWLHYFVLKYRFCIAIFYLQLLLYLSKFVHILLLELN